MRYLAKVLFLFGLVLGMLLAWEKWNEPVYLARLGEEVLGAKTDLGDPNVHFVMALEKDYPPFLFEEEGKVQGISYEYAQLIAKKMNKTMEVTAPMQLQDALEAVKTGKANLLSDITKTAERDKYLEFSHSYVETRAVIIDRKGSPLNWNKNQSNKGIRVAVGKGYGVESFLRDKYPEITLVEVDSDREVVHEVAFGSAEIGVLDAASLTYVLQRDPLANVEMVEETEFKYALSFAVPEDQKSVIPMINRAIAEISKEEKDSITNKWLGKLPSRSAADIRKMEIAGGLAVLVILIILGWGVVLKREVDIKTKELKSINDNLDKIIAQKAKEFELLTLKEQEKTKELDKTKKAVLNVLEDVQEEKAKVEEIKERFILATESAKIGVWQWNVLENTIEANSEFYALYQANELDFTNAYEGWMNYVHPEEKTKMEKEIKDSLEKKNELNFIVKILLPNGKISFLKIMSKINRDKDGKATDLVGVQWDVTRDTEVDRMKTDFISLASHQLRTPLTAMKWSTEMLLEEAEKLEPEQRKILEILEKSNQRMIDLVNALLNISRIESGRIVIAPVETSLKKLVETVMLETKTKVEEKEQKVKLEISNDLTEINIDPNLISQVYLNLMTNAVKYSPKGGEVEVKIYIKGEEVVSEVKDSGIGIPKKDQSRIFERFYRAENAVKKETDGTGLGLYLAKAIVESSGGKMWFESEEGKGSTFAFSLPLGGSVAQKGEVTLSV